MLSTDALTQAHYKITVKVLSALLSEQNLQSELLKVRLAAFEDAYEDAQQQVDDFEADTTAPAEGEVAGGEED